MVLIELQLCIKFQFTEILISTQFNDIKDTSKMIRYLIT